MARTFEENMNDKKLTVKSLRVLQEVEGGAFDKISSQIEETNQTIATLQGAQNRYWDSIADDNIITAEEKRILYKEKQTLDTEYSIVIQNAEKNKDYVDYTSLVEAYQNLNSYLAFIKLFENLSSNTKIDNRTEFYDAFDSYYIALNNVNQAILNKASVGDINVDKPDKITGVKAVASEKGIYVSFNQLSSEVKNNIGKYIYKLNKGDGVLYLFESQVNGFTYEFDRLVDGFPEADDIKDWEWCVSAVSVYGKENEDSNIATVNVDTYGTWIPNKDDINIIVSSNKRQISFSFNRTVSNKVLYGQIQYGLLVQRLDIDEENFYTPALDKNPALSEENYKQETTEPLYVTSYFSQTVPLAGQNNKKWREYYYETREGEEGSKADNVSYHNEMPEYPEDAILTYDENGNIIGVSYNDTIEKTFTRHYEFSLVEMPSPVDTTYKYKIDVWNKDTNLHYDIINPMTVIARANSASDLVDNAITQNALAPEAVTADKIAAGTISAEKIAAEDILAKGARAGMVSTEGLIVDDAAFLASKPLVYKYKDPNTGEEKTYTAESGEFFVGNTPILTDSSDKAEFLHYKKGQGFWLKIKNFILKGISTIIQGVFVVKSAESFNEFLIANSTSTMDNETLTPAKTLKIAGNQVADNIFCDNVYLGKPTSQSVTPVSMKHTDNFFYFENRIFFIDDTSKKLYECDNNFENIKLLKTFTYEKRAIIVDGETIIALGGEYFNYQTEVRGVISITVDNGNSWQDIETDLMAMYKAIIIDERIIFYCAYKGVYYVYYTDDLFASYTNILTLEMPIETFIKTDSNILYVGTTRKLYKSDDLGETFTESDINLIAVKNVLGDTLVGVGTSNNYLYVKKANSTNFNILSETYVNFKRDNDKLVAIHGNRIYTYDGRNFTNEMFFNEISVSRVLAVSTEKYLLLLKEAEKNIVTVNKDEKLIPIISDTNITEKSAWSSKKALESYFPVGIIIAFAIDVNPEEAIGGFWVRISDVFLLGAGNKYGGGDIGGSENVTLTENELPSHSHNIEHSHRVESSDKNASWYRYSGSSQNKINVNSSTGAPFSEFAIPYGTSTSISTNNSKTTGQSKAFSILPPYLGVYYWKRVKVKYRLSFDANGGIGEMISILEEPKTVVIPTNKFVREGYNFICFNTEPDGSGTTYVPGESLVLSEDITLYAIWKLSVSIPAGTYSPSAFKNLISQFITKNGNRTVKSEFTATVNNQTITVPANAKVYYNASYSGVEQIGFNSTSYGTIGGNFETFKHYIIYAEQSLSSMQNYVNYPITIGDVIFI